MYHTALLSFRLFVCVCSWNKCSLYYTVKQNYSQNGGVIPLEPLYAVSLTLLVFSAPYFSPMNLLKSFIIVQGWKGCRINAEVLFLLLNLEALLLLE